MPPLRPDQPPHYRPGPRTHNNAASATRPQFGGIRLRPSRWDASEPVRRQADSYPPIPRHMVMGAMDRADLEDAMAAYRAGLAPHGGAPRLGTMPSFFSFTAPPPRPPGFARPSVGPQSPGAREDTASPPEDGEIVEPTEAMRNATLQQINGVIEFIQSIGELTHDNVDVVRESLQNLINSAAPGTFRGEDLTQLQEVLREASGADGVPAIQLRQLVNGGHVRHHYRSNDPQRRDALADVTASQRQTDRAEARAEAAEFRRVQRRRQQRSRQMLEDARSDCLWMTDREQQTEEECDEDVAEVNEMGGWRKVVLCEEGMDLLLQQTGVRAPADGIIWVR
ncbi:hypothetical protein LTR56_026577 [Elasticomyces elasticus]|nr:hypothetical protein LTR56_026577 [Elasticomyces elasticus]KAK3624797.1 hypothetical protein LTR22_023836 [Elasticomyces elasticus]KAK4901432.1 hypothetical protein LTR49_027260 [Elasticomyces elasticus]KAK5748813.1 hypothetical protein LTS12_021110 [Elasticomyces elasticus]